MSMGWSAGGVLCAGVRGAQVLKTDYDPSIKSQLASTQLSLGPHVVNVWSRETQHLEGTGGVQSTCINMGWSTGGVIWVGVCGLEYGRV